MLNGSGLLVCMVFKGVYELDSGYKTNSNKSEAIKTVDNDVISEIEGQMAIVIPIKGERLKLLEGVLSGIPHDCLTIIVSNSPNIPSAGPGGFIAGGTMTKVGVEHMLNKIIIHLRQ